MNPQYACTLAWFDTLEGGNKVVRNERCAISVTSNCSLDIEYLDRPGHRVTSTIMDIGWLYDVKAESCILYVNTRNSVYVFRVTEGKYDTVELYHHLCDDWDVHRELMNALNAFVKCFA